MPQHDIFAQFEVQPDADPFAAFVVDAEPEAAPGQEPPSGGFLRTVIDRVMEGPQSSRPLVGEPAPLAGLRGVPVGRIMTIGAGALRGGVERIPIVGPVLRGAVRGGQRAFEATRPPPPGAGAGGTMPNLLQRTPRSMPPLTQPTPPASVAPTAFGPTPKPKLSAQQTAEFLRRQFGSEQAGRMLFGPTRGRAADVGSSVANAAARKEAIKRLAPMESQLPEFAQRAIQQGVQQRTGPEAWNYITKAPNQRARDYLISLMRGPK